MNLTLLLFVVFVIVILMTTTDQPTKSSIVIPSPHLSQTRSFTITNFTTFTADNFKFGNHPLYPMFSSALNNTYDEPFKTSVVDQLFIDANNNTVAADAIVTIWNAIIDTILISSTADQTVVAPIVNQMLIFSFGGNPIQKFQI